MTMHDTKNTPVGAQLPGAITISFEPGSAQTTLRWEADILGLRESRFTTPLPGDDLGLALRALDVLQDPCYPEALTAAQRQHFGFSQQQQARLASLGLWGSDGSVRSDAPRRIGQLLHAALTADPAGAQALGAAVDHAAALGQPLSLHLRFPPGAVSLASLPWELLWAAGPTPLLLNGGAGTCARHLSLAMALPPPRLAEGRLRILAVAPRAGIPAELRKIERAARLRAWQPLIETGRAQMREVGPADRLSLLAALDAEPPPDIVHFYGHGRYEDGQGALLLDAPGGKSSWASATTLAALFGGVGLVVLHACQGGAAGAASLLSGVAPALSAAGVPAVIAMQLSIRSDAATQLSAAIYADLAAGASIQQALATARRAMFVAEDDQVSWFVPVLYLRSREAQPVRLRRAEAAPASLATLGTDSALATAPDAPQDAAAPRPITRNSIQTLIARGGVIQRLWMRGGTGATQHVRVEDDGAISDAVLDQRSDL